MDRPDRWTVHRGACRPGHGSTFPLCSQQGIIPCVTNSSDRSSRRAGLCFRVMMAVGLSQLLARWPGTSPVSGIQVPASSTDCFRRPSKTLVRPRTSVSSALWVLNDNAAPYKCALCELGIIGILDVGPQVCWRRCSLARLLIVALRGRSVENLRRELGR